MQAVTAPTPDEGLRAAVLRLVQRGLDVYPRHRDPELVAEAVTSDIMRAVLAAVGPDSTGGQGRSVVEWGVRYEDGEVIRAGRGVIGESFARYSFGRRADPMAARLVLVGPRVPTALMSRLVLVTPDTFGPWQPVEEAEQA